MSNSLSLNFVVSSFLFCLPINLKGLKTLSASTLLGLRTLPLRLLGGLSGGSPLGVSGSSTPLLTSSTVPAGSGSSARGTGEASGGSLPVSTSGVLEARLDSGRALPVSAGELLLLDLVLSLSLGVTVCRQSVCVRRLALECYVQK